MSYFLDHDITAVVYKDDGMEMLAAFMRQEAMDEHLQSLRDKGRQIEIVETKRMPKSEYDSWRQQQHSHLLVPSENGSP